MDHAPTCICTDKISIALKANLQIWSTNQRGSRNKGIKYDVSDVYSCGLCTCWLHISKWRRENKMLSNHISLCGWWITSKVLPPQCIWRGIALWHACVRTPLQNLLALASLKFDECYECCSSTSAIAIFTRRCPAMFTLCYSILSLDHADLCLHVAMSFKGSFVGSLKSKRFPSFPSSVAWWSSALNLWNLRARPRFSLWFFLSLFVILVFLVSSFFSILALFDRMASPASQSGEPSVTTTHLFRGTRRGFTRNSTTKHDKMMHIDIDHIDIWIRQN